MKKKQENSYETIPLYISLIALVSTVGFGVVRGAVALKMYTPENLDTINLGLSISGAVVLLGVLIYAIIAPGAIVRFLSGRQVRYGSNALLMVLAFSGIVIVVNYLVYKNPGKPWDMTEDKQNTLSPEMVTALQSLPVKMTATAFYSQTPRETTQQLFENMRSNSKGNFDYGFVDPINSPLQARAAGITGDGKILLELAGRKEIAAYADETEILRAMVKLLNPEARTVYFLEGHGERVLNGSDPTAFGLVRETLKGKNYTVKSLNLLADSLIPEDAKAIIIAGPIQPLSSNEVSLLMNYALHGGSLIIMEDPLPFTDFGDQPNPLAESLERNWGIRIRNDFVVDGSNQQGWWMAVGAVPDLTHPITRTMNLPPLMPYTRSIEFSSQPEGVIQTALMQTNPTAQSWGETDFTILESDAGSISLDPEVDTPGPVILAAAAEISGQGRVVVIGSSKFATDEEFSNYGNGDLFVNSVDWAVGNTVSVDITTRSPTERTLKVVNQGWWLAIILGSVCILPGLVLAGGIASYVIRRRRG
jgi:ABC-type uncharacterized transport system involved in gliding motility auxiliary subunit